MKCKNCRKDRKKKYNSSFYYPCSCSKPKGRGLQKTKANAIKAKSKKFRHNWDTSYGFKNQIELFEYIWQKNTKNGERFSQLSGEEIKLNRYSPKWVNCFLHVLPKGSYPYFALNPENIIFATPEEHDRQEEFSYFNSKKEQLKREYYDRYY